MIHNMSRRFNYMYDTIAVCEKCKEKRLTTKNPDNQKQYCRVCYKKLLHNE